MECEHLNKLSILFQQNTIKTLNLVKIGQVVSEERLFNNIMILYMYTAQGQGKITLAE